MSEQGIIGNQPRGYGLMPPLGWPHASLGLWDRLPATKAWVLEQPLGIEWVARAVAIVERLQRERQAASATPAQPPADRG